MIDFKNTGNRFIIFADDDPDDLDLITHLFKEEAPGVSILEFGNGYEVLKFLDHETIRPELIVLDMNMPRLNGKETLKRIRLHDQYNSVPVVIFSTTLTESDEAFCRNHNASCIHKPLHLKEIKEVAKILAQFFRII